MKRNKLSKMIAAALVVLTLCGSVGVAYATEDNLYNTTVTATKRQTFTDVPTDSKYYEAVEYLVEHGATLGIGNNLYGVDREIRLNDLCVLMCRLFGFDNALELDAARNEWGTYTASKVHTNGWIPFEWMVSLDGAMCKGALYETLLTAYNMRYIHPELYTDYVEYQGWEMSVDIAKNLGICTEDESWKDIATRGDVANAIYMLDTGMCGVTEDTGYNITNNDRVYLVDYVKELDKIPDEIMNKFDACGWDIIIDKDHLDKYAETIGFDGHLTGLCMYYDKVIYLASEGSVIHEFGHFYDLKHGWPSERLWFEHSKAEEILGSYSQKDAYEYFACYFEYFIDNLDNQTKLDELKEATPYTYSYFERAMNNNWK